MQRGGLLKSHGFAQVCVTKGGFVARFCARCRAGLAGIGGVVGRLVAAFLIEFSKFVARTLRGEMRGVPAGLVFEACDTLLDKLLFVSVAVHGRGVWVCLSSANHS